MNENEDEDTGKHYRFTYRVFIKEQDIKNGFVDIKLDPARIAKIYKIESGMQFTILKKGLCCGNRGHNDYKEDLKDIICAAKRELEMLEEDEVPLQEAMVANIKIKDYNLASSVSYPEPIGAKID